jgi:hypothetical protein
MKPKRLLLVAAVFYSLLTSVGLVFAQGTAFTYQGRLTDNGIPANGNYDLRFFIYDALTGGSVVAGPITNAPVAVSNGLFTVALDFGSGVFTGPSRWLQIGARSNGLAVAYTSLSPRQELTPAPYSITAENLDGTLPASQLTGTLPGSLLGGTYPNPVTFSNPGDSFTGNGAGITNGPLATTNLSGWVSTNMAQQADLSYLASFAADPTPPLSWNSFGDAPWNVSEGVVKAATDFMATNGMIALGFKYVVIDGTPTDQMPTSRDGNGHVVFNPTNFPSGAKAVFDYIRSRGLHPGLWYEPIPIDEHGGQGFDQLESDMMFARTNWGIEYFKMGAPTFNPYDPVSVANAYNGQKYLISVALRTHIPFFMYLMPPGLVQNWFPSWVGSWRQSDPSVTGDAYTSGQGNGYYVMESWWNASTNYWGLIRPGFYITLGELFPNAVPYDGVGSIATDIRTWTAAHCMLSAPIILYNFPVMAAQGTLAYVTNSEILAINQDRAVLPPVLVTNANGIWVYEKPLGSQGGTDKAVWFWNRSTKAAPASITVSLERLGASNTVTVRDLWAKTWSAFRTNTMTISGLGPHDSKFFKLTAGKVAPYGPGQYFLSDQNWTGNVTNSTFGLMPQKDNASNGDPLTLGGTVYTKGLGIHADDNAEFFLGGVALTFHATIGVHDAYRGTAAVKAIVYADNAVLYDTGTLANSGPGVTLDLNVSDVAVLSLVVTNTEAGGVALLDDSVDVADAYFTVPVAGDGSGLTSINASQLTSGTVPSARLGSGTANSTTVLFGDSVYRTVGDIVAAGQNNFTGSSNVFESNLIITNTASATGITLNTNGNVTATGTGTFAALNVNGNGPSTINGDANLTNSLVVSPAGVQVTNAGGGLLLIDAAGNSWLSNNVYAKQI